ncbi:MAG: hypothetical protein EOM80_06150 [Erysipelotrichia bacterium]|nr:hypothetical protein [Erysipelotrichia bacterium]
MQRNLLFKESSKDSCGEETRVCSFCNKGNPVIAKFCGGCGRSTRFSPIEGRRKSSTGTKATIKKPSCTNKPGAISLLRRLSLKERKFIAGALLILLITLSGAIFVKHPEQIPEEQARWNDFRAFLARRFEMPHYELDSFYTQTTKMPVDAYTSITLKQALALEKCFKETFRQQNLTIFPNPFFDDAQAGQLPLKKDSDRKFVDVPETHPVYMAIQPLLDLGIKCSDEENKIRPYDKITWSEWEKITSDMMTLLSVEKDLIKRLSAQQTGNMSNIDLRNFLEHLRERLYIKNASPLIYARETFFPSRLEALAALANLIKEMSASR